MLALGVLTGVAAAVSLAALAGARRADTAYDRLSEATGAADAVVFASQADIYAPDWSPVAELPYVEAAGSFGIPFVQVVDGPEGVDLDLGIFSVPFGTWRTDVDRPVITKGRAPDPTNPHELLAPPEALGYGIDVGQEYVVRLPSDEQIEALDLFGEAQGELVPLRVVGIGRSTFELAVIPGGAGFVGTPAFHDTYGAPVTFIDNLLVRFRPGEGSIGQLERDVREIFDSPLMPVLDAEAVSKRVTNGTGLEATGLAMFGLAVALAGSVLIGQALTRSVRSGAADLPALTAMGFTRFDAAVAMAMPHLVVVVVGVVVAVVGATALSPRFPIGLSRKVDPEVGVHVDLTVLGLGISLMVVVLVGTAAVTAYRSTSRSTSVPRSRRPRLVDLVAGAGARPSFLVGANLALEPGRDRRALPTRPALAGVVVGVIGVIGAQTLLAGMDDAIGDPARFGAGWDIETSVNDIAGVETFDEVMRTVEDTEGVVASALTGRALIVFDGVTQPTYSITPRQGSLDYTVLEGRRPAARGEVALGPDTADASGVGIGDSIPAVGGDGSATELRVVGIALLPTTPHSSYDQGAWVAPDQLVELAGAPVGELRPGADPAVESPPIVPMHLAVLDDADPDAVAAILDERLDSSLHDAAPATEPLDISNLRNVRSLPALFAVFTMVLAVGTVAHVCASVVRRRGTELAVLRAMGLTPRGTRGAVAWQATTLSLIGLLVGLPLGVIVGRLLWGVIADLTPLVFVPPLAGMALAVAIPVAVLAANAIALLPGRRAARIRPAELLHHE